MIESDLDKNFDNFFDGVANDIRNELIDTVPVDTGRLKSSITVKNEGNGIFEISMSEYGKFIEFGTSPHIITPKDKKALFWKGAKHPVKLVNHPGTRPNPFIRNVFYNKLNFILKENFERHFK